MVDSDNKINVLYVEDNKENAKLMQHIFDGLFDNVNLIIATTAEDGLNIISQTRLDLTLMDIDLPGMDGYAALNKIRADYPDSELPVIAVSAYATQAQINKGIKAGFSEYVTKPLNVQSLRKIITRYLEKI